MKTRRIFSIVVLLIIMALVGTAFTACSLFDFSDLTTTGTDEQQEVDISSNKLSDSATNKEIIIQMVEPPAGTDSSLVQVVESVSSSVVDVIVKIKTSGRYGTTSTSSGSGVIISYDEEYSYILTCFHVIENFSSIQIRLANQDLYVAEYLGGVSSEDIAVVRIKKTGLTTAQIRKVETSPVKLGEDVIVIGNPLGTLGGTVTRGIIGGLAREIVVDGQNMTLLQTDASINSGNSGGGMFDINGLLIGIVDAKMVGTDVEGLGFAIPIEKAMESAMQVFDTIFVLS
ncbi:MAG: trypsin-like peptidase domain-containing protein [Christensenellaceae bacterium]|jgi:serine protease Do|nr:trypsin-like peptidase domain-containing protein [Christensenellaceae bacterium]